ncbi:DUF6758 family protein [Plantactinospora siamensis]|uniref:DUF6758 family protein n=1 Tax=Plantactinospora siamensis TaxID=555372 RepID=A0ABV6NXB0_9ACTN
MGVSVSCPRCGGPVREPDLMHTEWRCPDCGPVPPLHTAEHVGAEIVAAAAERVAVTAAQAGRPAVPLWCPWPLLPGWTVTGVAWAGDDRTGVRAAAVACSGPAPLGGGPADLVLVAEEPGVGLGNRFAALSGPDPGAELADVMTQPPPGHAEVTAHAKIRAGGHPTPLWSVGSATDRSAYVGEARGMWLYAITWPASAGYVLADEVVLQDLAEWTPPELVFGAPCPYLHGKA